jgi:hypothetical protein
MTATFTRASRSRPAPPADVQQFYVTHCLRGTGVSLQAGFGVRAASLRDPLLLRFALAYPTYAIPDGRGDGRLAPQNAPRRLAFVRIPGGRRALIHSVYLPENPHGRANNFFSHVLVLSTGEARRALVTWASPDWVTDCPAEAGKDLPELDELPRPGPVGDDAVTAFLQANVPVEDRNLATLTCPERLAGDLPRRRRLLELVLRGCLRVQRARAGDPRSRLYLLAEPGLAALLLYAATRLLPPPLMADLTFSTYENLASTPGADEHARVVATFPADPRQGLPEALRARGYVLDTWNQVNSPELAGTGESVFDGWIDLAARGDWETIDGVYGQLGKVAVSVVSLPEGRAAATACRQLAAGQATADDLLALKGPAWGAKVLAEHRAQVWPLVRDGSRTDPRLRQAFADLLREGVAELEQRALQALNARPRGDWPSHWQLLGFLLKDDAPRLQETLQRLLPEPPWPAALRLALVQELQSLPLALPPDRPPLRTLLADCTADDLDRFAGSSVPPGWFAWALVHTLGRPATRAEVVRHLLEGPDALVRAFGGHLQDAREEDRRRVLLAPLFPPGDSRGLALLSRLLRGRCGLRPETMDWLLDRLGLGGRDASAFWLRDRHLELLLEGLREFGDDAGPMWDRFCRQFDREVLAGDPGQQALLAELAAARKRLGPGTPRNASQVVADWDLLCRHFAQAPAEAAEPRRRAVREACGRRGLDPVEVLAVWFGRFVQPQGPKAETIEAFAGFFHGFFPDGDAYPDHNRRLSAWLEVVSVCRDEAERAVYQRHYLERCVPLPFRRRLTEEALRAGKLLPVEPPALPRKESSTPPAPAPVASVPDRGGPDDGVFQLSGLRRADGTRAGLRSLGERLAWLLCRAAGGGLAAFLSGLTRVPAPQLAILAPFLPLVLALAEETAVQSVARVGPAPSGRVPPRGLGTELLAGLCVSVVSGLVGAALAALLAVPGQQVWALGMAVAGGVAGAAVLGLAVPLLLRAAGCAPRVAAGPPARALASLAALALYFTLAGRLLGG